jgi:hypothetical protein
VKQRGRGAISPENDRAGCSLRVLYVLNLKRSDRLKKSRVRRAESGPSRCNLTGKISSRCEETTDLENFEIVTKALTNTLLSLSVKYCVFLSMSISIDFTSTSDFGTSRILYNL